MTCRNSRPASEPCSTLQTWPSALPSLATCPWDLIRDSPPGTTKPRRREFLCMCLRITSWIIQIDRFQHRPTCGKSEEGNLQEEDRQTRRRGHEYAWRQEHGWRWHVWIATLMLISKQRFPYTMIRLGEISNRMKWDRMPNRETKKIIPSFRLSIRYTVSFHTISRGSKFPKSGNDWRYFDYILN